MSSNLETLTAAEDRLAKLGLAKDCCVGSDGHVDFLNVFIGCLSMRVSAEDWSDSVLTAEITMTERLKKAVAS